MVKQGMVSLALAGTLSAAQFLASVQNYEPPYDAQSLNTHKQMISSASQNHIGIASMASIREALDTMRTVNEKTFSELIPALDISLQRWIKTDQSSTFAAIDTLVRFVDIRLKQYENMQKLCAKTSSAKVLIDEIVELKKMSTEARKILKQYRKNGEIISMIAQRIAATQSIKIDDFWLPVIEPKENIVLVKVDRSQMSVEDVEAVETLLSAALECDYIDSVMVA